jgi:hypothetical protein
MQEMDGSTMLGACQAQYRTVYNKFNIRLNLGENGPSLANPV